MDVESGIKDESYSRLFQLEQAVTALLEQYGFTTFSSFAERHGAYELRLIRENGVSFNLISPACSLSMQKSVRFQVWAGSSMKLSTEPFVKSERILVGSPTVSDFSAVPPAMKHALQIAVETARDIEGRLLQDATQEEPYASREDRTSAKARLVA